MQTSHPAASAHPSMVVLAETHERHENLLPLSFTRPVAEFRVGITTIAEKWQSLLPGDYRSLPVDYLRRENEMPPMDAEALFVNGALLPSPELLERALTLQPGEAIVREGEPLLFRGTAAQWEAKEWREVPFEAEVKMLWFVFDVFLLNGEMVEADYRRLTEGRRSVPLDSSNLVIGSHTLPDGCPAIFLEEGASVQGAILNVKEGPIYIGKDASVMEGSCLRGPLALCHRAKVNMGAKVYGKTTLGPYCKVGGELNNVVMFGYSNKAHDGFLGNAVVGEWCNIGAGTNASNLKNDYSKIRIWNYARQTFMRTDLQFCGLIMGDHSKAGINCMFNTATVLGVGVNIHGSEFPRVFVPGFSEGSPAGGFTNVELRKFFDIANRVMSRRDRCLSEADKQMYERIYEVAMSYKH